MGNHHSMKCMHLRSGGMGMAYLLVAIALATARCSGDGEETEQAAPPKPPLSQDMQVPVFNADSAYAFIARQVQFGPRTPGSRGHDECRDWLVRKLSDWLEPENVLTQEARMALYNEKMVTGTNIIGLINPGLRRRVLLCAHWDTRMVADQDNERQNEPIPGANDGGSGTGVLLEIARQLSMHPVQGDYGIDIILFDLEDQGVPHNSGYRITPTSANTWCLGSQYWARHRHRFDYQYAFGILLDMVGGSDAEFPMEGYSVQFARRVVNRIWEEAASLGYSGLFKREQGNPIVDDHYFINTIAGIPVADIVHYNAASGRFGIHWHTHSDNMDWISKPTLKAVGQTVMNVVFRQQTGSDPL